MAGRGTLGWSSGDRPLRPVKPQGDHQFIAFGGNRQSGPLDVATAVLAKGGTGRGDFESETFVACVAPPVTSNPYGDHESRDGLLVTHSLRADGFDASEDGTGCGTPLVTHALDAHSAGSATEDESGRGVPLTLAIRGRGDSHDLEWRDDGTANAILTPNGGRGGIGVGAVAQPLRSNVYNNSDPGMEAGMHIQQGMSIRRLTPAECEKLQGLPPGWTDIQYRGKPAADGPRYRAIGNSMAVPVVRWIARRIDIVAAASRGGEGRAA